MGVRPFRVLVVGNGPSGLAADGSVHVDRSGGQLMEQLAEHAEVTFAQPVERVETSLNYYGHVLSARIRPLLLDRRRVGAALSGSWALVVALARADFVYLFYPGTLPRLVGRLCLLAGKAYGMFLRGSQFDARADARLIARAQFVQCVSQALADTVATHNPRAALVRSAQDLRAEDAWLRPPAQHGQTSLRLLYVGRIDEEKGVPELLEAARILHAQGAAFELTLVGFGRLGERVERQLADEPTLPVSYPGAIDDRMEVMRLFRQADVFVLPSHHEGFARVLYEAMLQSCTIVSTMVGGIPAVLRDEVNCLAIPVGDAQAIAAAIRRLAQDPSLRSRLAENGYSTVMETIARVPLHADALLARLKVKTPAGPGPAGGPAPAMPVRRR